MNIIIDKNVEGLEVVKVGVLPNHNRYEELSDGTVIEYITLTDSTTGDKENYAVNIGSDFWYEVKCVEIPQKIAKKHKAKGGRHFEENDLVSFLTETAYKKLVKFDRTKVDFFESFMRRWLGKNVVDFFRESMIDKSTDLETSLVSKNEGEDGNSMEVFDEPVDVWEGLHSELTLEEMISELSSEEQLIINRLLEGYNSAEISRELGTYKMKVSRIIKATAEKLNLEKPVERKTKRVSNLVSTTAVETTERMKRNERLKDQLALENRILGGTITLWGMERALEQEAVKISEIKDDETRINKEALWRSKAETVSLFAKELEELEKKFDRRYKK